MKNRNKTGFTLVELIMVIAVLSIISTLAISKYGSMQANSARKLSVSNQIRITQAVETFLVANEGGLDKLDALIEYGTADGTAGTFAGEYDESLNNATTEGGIYRGPKGVGVTTDVLKKNAGLSPELAKILCVYYPTDDEVKALTQLGLKRLMRAWTDPAASPDDRSVTGEDGSYSLIANGIDSLAGSALVTSNAVGRALAAVNIAYGGGSTNATNRAVYKKGVRIYKEMGADATITTDADNYDDPADAQPLGTLLAFGLGDASTILGNPNAGITTLPTAEFLEKKYYRNYILLVRLHKPSSNYGTTTAQFVGVLDANGNTVDFAKSSLD